MVVLVKYIQVVRCTYVLGSFIGLLLCLFCAKRRNLRQWSLAGSVFSLESLHVPPSRCCVVRYTQRQRYVLALYIQGSCCDVRGVFCGGHASLLLILVYVTELLCVVF